MHPFPIKDVDSTGKRGGDRWNKDRVAPIVELLNDEGRDERFFNLGQCRLPDVFVAFTRQLLGQAPDERVAWNSFEEGSFNPLPDHPSCPSADGNADQEADHQHEEKGQSLLSGNPVREEQGEWPYQAP